MKIISGGQSGVDRAALDFCLDHDLPCSGWCPKGRIAEDGVIANKYPLIETISPLCEERTRLNVENSDGTLILFKSYLDTGTLVTKSFLVETHKPLLLIDLSKNELTTKEISNWIKKNKIEILNIAGPRESNSQGIYQDTLIFLNDLFLPLISS